MSRNVRLPRVVLALLAAGPAVLADESSVRLAQGEGVEQVQAACAICHSLDYIVMNSPFQDRAAWEKTVTKMVKVMGAPHHCPRTRRRSSATSTVTTARARNGRALTVAAQ